MPESKYSSTKYGERAIIVDVLCASFNYAWHLASLVHYNFWLMNTWLYANSVFRNPQKNSY